MKWEQRDMFFSHRTDSQCLLDVLNTVGSHPLCHKFNCSPQGGRLVVEEGLLQLHLVKRKVPQLIRTLHSDPPLLFTRVDQLPYVIEIKGRQFAYTRIFCYSNTQHLYRIHLPYFFFLTWSSSPVFMKLQKQMTSKEKNGRVLAAPMQFLSSVECMAKI